MKKQFFDNTSDEVLAAFLDGNASAEECQDIIDALSVDAGLRELLHVSQLVDQETSFTSFECDFLPMTAMAASCKEGAFCSLECEKHVLQYFDIEFDETVLMQNALKHGWQKDEGTALHNVGRHLEDNGLILTRSYNSTVSDIVDALDSGKAVIAAVDGGELIGDRVYEIKEDILFGQIPDHVVVVTAVDIKESTITVFDPASQNPYDVYPIWQFEDAWNDSKKYMIAAVHKNAYIYQPRPIDLSDVELTDELEELREAIAENAHDVWAIERQAQGWTYGPCRDDAKMETPCMVAYSQLPDSEKEFDRNMAMNTLKLVKKLGYDIVKREETQPYKVLKKRIGDSGEELFCRKCGNPLYKHQRFCDNCGLGADYYKTII